ncbi:energy-coupling factor transporter transmembrane component T family protein [Chryseobacterium sp. CT-SW4]|uniref:hypothetical protein n=1 Tax=Chryseobacterium sp. SW-1 TaxID=3157343 RepID=UPI003B02AF13
MSVNKNILEKLSSHELEKYIQPDSRFIPEAIIYASEILQSRGRELTPEEEERISLLKADKRNGEIRTIHPYYSKAAHLIYLSGAMGIAIMILDFEKFNSGFALFIAIVVLGVIFGLGYLISKGTEWSKYILLFLLISGVFGIPVILSELRYNTISGIINITQTGLQLWATILLFQIPQTPSSKDPFLNEMPEQ